VIGERGLDKGLLEYRQRTAFENEDIPLESALKNILERLG
jgi:hypothetical protein